MYTHTHVMEKNTLTLLLNGPQSTHTREIEGVIQNVMIGSYADFEIAIDDIMGIVASKNADEGGVQKKLIRVSKNAVQFERLQVTRPDVKAYIQRKLRACPSGAQVLQVEMAAKMMEMYGQMQRESMNLLLSLTTKQTDLIRDMNEITEELDEKDKEKLATDIDQIAAGNAGNAVNAANPVQRQVPIPAAVAPEEEENDGDEAMEVEGNEDEIEARELGAAAGAVGAGAGNDNVAEPMTEEARKAEFVTKKMERIMELEKQIAIVTKRQKFCAGQIEKNLRIVQSKKSIFK